MKWFLYRFLFFFSLGMYGLFAQTVESVIVDKQTREVVPYAQVFVKNNTYGVSNDEGFFRLHPNPYNLNDTLEIRLMGYEKLALPIKAVQDSLFLQPNPFSLNEVIVSNNSLSAEEVIERVIRQIPLNYPEQTRQRTVFLRESTFDSVRKFSMNLEESTIPEINESIILELEKSIPKKSNFFVESLFDLYGKAQQESAKIDLIKASVLRDEDATVDTDIIEKKMGKLLENKVKNGSYFKVKSGIFGAKLETDDFHLDTQDSLVVPKEKTEEEITKERKQFNNNRKSKIRGLYQDLFYSEEASLDVVDKSNKYIFEIVQLGIEGDDLVYIIDFEPKRSADFKGRMWVHASDFAVLRMEYENLKPLKSFGLLGISFKEHIASGQMVFRKNESGSYELQFAETLSGNLVSLKRPLKIIEKRKTGSFRRRQNEVSFNFDFRITSIEKKELLVLKSLPIGEKEVNKFKSTYGIGRERLNAYDPNFWKGTTIIEPNEKIKSFKIN